MSYFGGPRRGGYPPAPYAPYPTAYPSHAAYGGYDSFAAGYGGYPPHPPPGRGFGPRYPAQPYDQGRGFGGRGGGGRGGGGQRGGRGQRGGAPRGRGGGGGFRGRGRGRGGRGGANVPRDAKGKKLNKQQIRQQVVEERRKQTGFFFFYHKKLRCCNKVVTKECPHILQPQPWDLLMVYDDPSYADETINAPYMKEVEDQQQVKRARFAKKFYKKLGIEGPANGEPMNEDDEKPEKTGESAKEKEDNGEKMEEEVEEEEEEEVPTQTLTLGSFLANLASSAAEAEAAPAPDESKEKEEEEEKKKKEEEEKKKKEEEEKKEPWVWPQPFKPKDPTKRQRKQGREVPQGLACMVSIPDQKRRKYNHSWVQVHKQKPWIAIPCITRLVKRRDELKEEFQDLEKHLKWHPDDSEAVKKKNDVEKVFKRLRNRVHSFLKRLELQYMTAGFEGVNDLIGQFLEERHDEDGIEVIFKKEHDDAAAERLAAEEEAKRLEESKRPREDDDDDAAAAAAGEGATNGDAAANGDAVVNGEGANKKAKTDP